MLRRGERNEPVAHEQRGHEHEQDADRRRLGGPAAGEQEQRQADEADRHAGERPAVTRSPPTVERMSTSHSGTEAMSSAASPAGTSRSATVTRPLPPAGSSRPTSAGGGQAAGRDADAVPARGEEGEHRDAGDREARAGAQQRRDVLDHHADGDVGPAPEHVDDAERRPHPPGGRSEGVAGARC